MIRSKLSLRRPLAVLGATALGLGAATLVVSPASAHHPEIVGTYCQIQHSDKYQFSWTVGNSETKWEARIITVLPGAAGNIKVGAVLPKKGQGVLEGTEVRIKKQYTGLNTSLTVIARWDKEKSFVIQSKTVKAKSKGKCVDTPPTTVPPTTPPPTVPPTTPPATPEPTTPAPTTPVPTPTVTLPPSEPVGTVEATCDELIFTVENPQDGKEITVTLTPNKGEPKTLTVAPGETGSVSFPAEEGLTVTPSGDGLDKIDPITWEKPDNCDSDGEGGGLPVTGAAAGGIAAGALLLLGAGAGLYIVARRRRVTFTA